MACSRVNFTFFLPFVLDLPVNMTSDDWVIGADVSVQGGGLTFNVQSTVIFSKVAHCEVASWGTSTRRPVLAACEGVESGL